MSVATGARHPDRLRAFAFGDPESDVWGAAWIPPGPDDAAVIGAGDEASSVSVVLEGEAPDEPWRLRGAGTNLILEGLEASAQDRDAPGSGFDQLCRVNGSVAVAGADREVSCLGWRGARPAAVVAAEVASLRQVAAWFAPDDGFTLLALRSGRAKGQDSDTVSAAMFSPTDSSAVADARLSTTYADSGEPVRAGVELWIQTGEDPDQQYPRRAVGEAVQPAVSWALEGLVLEALPFRWYAGGREGPGIYLLGHRG